jgi:hypothetical protein
VLLLSGAIFCGLSLGRGWTLSATRARLSLRYQAQIAVLPEGRAVRLLRTLGQAEGEWSDVLLAASADARPAVAEAAERTLREAVDRWARLPAGESSVHIAGLARLLAHEAPRLAAERRQVAHALAERLIEWPIDGRRVDAGRLIADCESVLLLPRAEPTQLVAEKESALLTTVDAASVPPGSEQAIAPAAPVVQPEVRVAAAAPQPAPPQVTQPQAPQALPPPAALPDANREAPAAPRPLRPSGAIRISDD